MLTDKAKDDLLARLAALEKRQRFVHNEDTLIKVVRDFIERTPSEPFALDGAVREYRSEQIGAGRDRQPIIAGNESAAND